MTNAQKQRLTGRSDSITKAFTLSLAPQNFFEGNLGGNY